MCDYLNIAADSVAGPLNLPSEYGYLLIGLILGLLLGWIFGRQRPKANAAVPFGEVGGILPPAVVHEASGSKPAGVSLVVNGKTVEVAPNIMEEIQYLIMQGKKIEAIKRLRDASGLNLSAAKSVVESLGKVIH